MKAIAIILATITLVGCATSHQLDLRAPAPKNASTIVAQAPTEDTRPTCGPKDYLGKNGCVVRIQPGCVGVPMNEDEERRACR